MTSTLHPAQAFIADHGQKLLRYCGVSVVNVFTGQSLLLIGLVVLDLGGVVSQIVAASLSAIPAYILSRRWVWQQNGRDSFRSEVLPFWIMALVGLLFATAAVGLVERVSDIPLVLMATSLAAYGVVWVAKYVILDKFMWRTPSSSPSR